MLRGVAANVIPWCLRPNEDVHLDPNAWIAVDCTESNSVYFALVHSGERGPAGLAEGHAPPGCGFELGQVVLAADPRE